MPLAPLVYASVDECGSLTADSSHVTFAAVVTQYPDSVRNLIRRIALRSGKRLHRSRKAPGEFKWRNTSERIRRDVLTALAQHELELFALTINKQRRRIEDSPENYTLIICALLSLLNDRYPNVALALDRHFTSPTQIALINTLIYRRWPPEGILSVNHVDSQRNPMVQLADFVAGCVYAHTADTLSLIESKLSVEKTTDWQDLKAEWLRERE